MIKDILKYVNTCFYTFFLVLFSSCATLVHTPYQDSIILVHPSNTRIYCNKKYLGNDSVYVKLRRSHVYHFEFENDSCVTKELLLVPKPSFSGSWYYILDSVSGLLSFVNPLLGGLAVFITVSIDFATGSYLTLHPYSGDAKKFQVKVQLQKFPCYLENKTLEKY